MPRCLAFTDEKEPATMSNKGHNQHPPKPQVQPSKAQEPAPPAAEDRLELLNQRATEAAKENPDKALIESLDNRLAALDANPLPPEAGKQTPPTVTEEPKVGATPPAAEATAAPEKVNIEDVAKDLADYKMVQEAGLGAAFVAETGVEVTPDDVILVKDLAEASALLRHFLDLDRDHPTQPNIVTNHRNLIRQRQSALLAQGGGTLEKEAIGNGATNQTGVYNGEILPRFSHGMGHSNWDWGVGPDGSPVKVSLDPADKK